MKYRLETLYTQYGTNAVWVEETDDVNQIEVVAKRMIHYSVPAGYVNEPEAITVIDTESGNHFLLSGYEEDLLIFRDIDHFLQWVESPPITFKEADLSHYLDEETQIARERRQYTERAARYRSRLGEESPTGE